MFLVVCAPLSASSGFPVTASHLVSRSRRIKLADQFRKPLGNPLAYHVVVHGAELVADPCLNLGIEAALPAGWGVLGLRFCILHDLFHVFPG